MIVVTGGAGFIGSCLVAGLERAGASKVVVVDRLDHDAQRRNLSHRANLAAIVPPGALDDFLDRDGGHVEAVFHLGAISSTTETDEALLERVNVGLSRTLWRFATARGVPFVYASSAATYGDGLEGFDDAFDGQYLRRLKPLNPYGASKHRFDLEVLRMVAGGEKTPPVWAGLKFFNVYGPNEYHKGGQRSVLTTHHFSKLPRVVVAGRGAEGRTGCAADRA